MSSNDSATAILLEDGTILLAEDGSSIELESAPAPTPTVCPVDPCAATLVLGPGMAASSAPCRLTVIQGSAADWPLQTWNRGGLTSPILGQYDTLAAAIYQRGVPTPICTPAVQWYTAPDPFTGNPTQNGYQQGQVVVSASNPDTAELQPTGGSLSYTLSVSWSAAATPSRSVEIVRLPLAVTRNY